MARRIEVDIIGDSRSLERSFANSSRAGQKFSVGLGTILKSALVFGAVEKGVEGVTAAIGSGIEAFSAQQQASAQTRAVLKSTGAAANVTAGQIGDLAQQLSNLSGQTKPAVQGAENVLLSFTRIRNFAGKGNDIFNQATKTVVDFSTRTGRAANSAALIIGRALQDPATKATSLARAGVVLTKSQLDSLKAVEKNNGVLAAQQVLLRDLAVRFKGAAQAAGQTLPGELDRLRNSFREFAAGILGDLEPAVKGALESLNGFVDVLSKTKGFKAKIALVFEEVGDVGRDLLVKVRRQLNAINWGTVPARIGLALTTVGDAGKQIFNAVKKQVAAVDWTRIGGAAKGIGEGFQARLDAIDWSKVGKTIGDGIAKGVADAAGVVKPLAAKLDAAFRTAFASIDFNKFGRAAGPGLAAAMVSAIATLLDPSFWIKNWDLALAIATATFSDGLGRIAGKFAAPFARLAAKVAPELGRFGEEISLKLLGEVEKVSPRVASLFLDIGTKAAELFGRGLSNLGGFLDRTLARLLGPFVRFYQRASGLLRFSVKVLGIQAAIDEIAKAFTSIAHTVEHALDGAFNGLKEKALKAVLDIIEPFTHLPAALGGGPFQAMKAQLKKQLDAMVSDSQTAAAAMNAAFGTVKAPAGPVGPATAANQAIAPPTPRSVLQRPTASTGGTLPSLPPPPPAPPTKGLTAAQKNTFFDNAISSDLTRAGFITNVKAQIGALQRIAGLISQRISKTKDITRLRTLENQLLSVQSQIKGDQAQVASDFLASLQLGITEAQATTTFKDDIRALTALENGIKAEIASTGKTTDLLGQLFDARQQLKQAQLAQRDASQFFTLGLGPTGDTRVPLVGTLQKQLANVSAAVQGTFLDTNKTKSVLANIKAVLSAGIGNVSASVRSKIEEMLQGIRSALANHTGELTKFAKANTTALLKAAGLDPDQIRRVRAALSQVSSTGNIPGAGQGAFGFAIPGPRVATAAAGQSGNNHPPETIHVQLNVDGKKMADVTTKHDQKRRRRNPVQKRGPNAGGV